MLLLPHSGHLSLSDQCTVNGLYSCPQSLQFQTEPFCLPATLKSWQGLPPQIILNGEMLYSSILVISPRFNDSSTLCIAQYDLTAYLSNSQKFTSSHRFSDELLFLSDSHEYPIYAALQNL